MSIVDLVTIRQFNLYADLLDLVEKSDPMLGAEPPAIYAATVRACKRTHRRPLLDFWFYPMAIGQPLPPLPLWLDVDLGVTVDLEARYEAACHFLHIS